MSLGRPAFDPAISPPILVAMSRPPSWRPHPRLRGRRSVLPRGGLDPDSSPARR